MTKSPMFWGAGLACVLGGAIAGNALGSTPVLDRPTIESFYQTHESGGGQLAVREPLPDHYPLVTKAGTVPVGELATRGLYSQARYRAVLYAADYGPSEAELREYGRTHDNSRHDGSDPALAVGDPPRRSLDDSTDFRSDFQPPAPLGLDAGPAAVVAQGNARLINVQATLAMR